MPLSTIGSATESTTSAEIAFSCVKSISLIPSAAACKSESGVKVTNMTMLIINATGLILFIFFPRCLYFLDPFFVKLVLVKFFFDSYAVLFKAQHADTFGLFMSATEHIASSHRRLQKNVISCSAPFSLRSPPEIPLLSDAKKSAILSLYQIRLRLKYRHWSTPP